MLLLFFFLLQDHYRYKKHRSQITLMFHKINSQTLYLWQEGIETFPFYLRMFQLAFLNQILFGLSRNPFCKNVNDPS